MRGASSVTIPDKCTQKWQSGQIGERLAPFEVVFVFMASGEKAGAIFKEH
jgi:hypothetical protein